jgi:hypothetical protein
MELSGVHVGKKAKITYRFKTWKPNISDAVLNGYIGSIRHMPGGELWLTMVQSKDYVKYARSAKAVRVPYDGEVEFLDD